MPDVLGRADGTFACDTCGTHWPEFFIRAVGLAGCPNCQLPRWREWPAAGPGTDGIDPDAENPDVVRVGPP